jgi:LysM repeat protein
MKKNCATLYMLILLPIGLAAQNYIAPPPLLPNPARNTFSSPFNQGYDNLQTNSNPATFNQSTRTHIVQKGESLYRISRLYLVSVEDIKAWNNLNSDLIAAGTTLSIGLPGSNASNAIPDQYNQMSARAVPGWLSGDQSHALKVGETLASVAVYYGFTVERLRSMNNLGANELVQPGFVLKVNPCADSYLGNTTNTSGYQLQETTSKGASEAQNYKSPVPKTYVPYDRFANSNNPGVNTPIPYGYPNNPANVNTMNGGVYRPEDQYDANLNNNQIPTGYNYNATDRAVVPGYQANANNQNLTFENGRRVYLVGNYDTVETIADAYNMSADRLRLINNLSTSDFVRPNQKLYLE